jgi:hypothetical protein
MYPNEVEKFQKMEWKRYAFGIRKHLERKIHLIVFGHFIDPNQVINDLRALGLRPIDVFELAGMITSGQMPTGLHYEALGSPQQVNEVTVYPKVYVAEKFKNFDVSKSQDNLSVYCFPAVAI